MDTAIAIAVTSIAFLIYHFLGKSSDKTHDSGVAIMKQHSYINPVLFNRLFGAILFFGVPFLSIILLHEQLWMIYFFRECSALESMKWIAILSAIIIVLNFFNASKKRNLAMYPQIRIPVWTPLTILVSAVTWVAYLFGYEFMFRGYLLFAISDELGTIPAIIINTCIYSLVHIPKGKTEAFGSIPLGIILCYLTLQTGNIMVAFIIHVVMALTNEWFSIRANPEMKVIMKNVK